MNGMDDGLVYSEVLAAYAATLEFGDAPQGALRAARACLVDAVACAVFGSRFPWSRIVAATAALPPGKAMAPGAAVRTDPGRAAYLSGVFAHAFELDSLRKPGAGVHPGATVALPALAMAQAVDASGRDLLAAIVAGCEVMFRIGKASLHTAEKKGFHAPGITGVFGSAIACGRLLRLPPDKMERALGLAGSMTGGLLAFAASGTGGMVKRLHLGRAAESGVLAAQLAAGGYEGPKHILEGRFGVLQTFCEHYDLALLNEGLGERFEIETLCIKRYACHVTAQAPVEMLAGWMAREGFAAADIAAIRLAVPLKIASHHAERDPADIALAQYSVPFMLAFSAIHGLDDPAALTEAAVAAPEARALARRIELTADEALKGWTVRMQVELRDGRAFSGQAENFLGAPERPLSDDQLRERFHRLTSSEPRDQMESLFAGLMSIETLDKVNDLPLGG